MNEWYKDWFASEDYLTVYKHRNFGDAIDLINTILGRLDVTKHCSVLDAACGAGRHSILFAKEGFNVTAFDLSKTLLKAGVRNAKNENVNVDFFCSDIRNAPLKTKFDLILNLFTSFGYFEDDGENFLFLKNAKKILAPEGYFVFDYFNERYLIKNLVPHTERRLNGKDIVEDRFFKNKRVIKTIKISDGKRANVFKESVRLYGVEEIEERLFLLGYNVAAKWGDYKGSEFDEDNSERLILVLN